MLSSHPVDSESSTLRSLYDSDERPHPFVEEWLELYRYRHLLWQWSSRNLTLRYKRSVLGILWTLLEPLMIMTILTIVFSALFRFELPNYPVYVLTGFSLWDFFRRSSLGMMDEVTGSQSLSTRVYLPQSTFAVASVVTYLVNWLLTMLPLLLIILLLGHPIEPALAVLPAAMVLVVLFTLGVGLIVSTIATFFPDFGLMYQVLLTGLMYATPIIYPLDVVPPRFQAFLLLNPLTHLLALVRDPIYEGVVPAPGAWLLGLALALGALTFGWWIFTRYRDAFSYVR